MKNATKILTVAGCGAVVWGLSYSSSLYPQFAMVFASFCAGVTALCGIITGFVGPTQQQ